MRITIAIVLLVLLSSCLTVRRIERNCELFARVCGTNTESTTIYKDTTIVVDRVVPVFLPRDTARVAGLVNLTNSGVQMPKMTAQSGIVTIMAEVKDSQLTATGYINRDSILNKFRDSLLINKAIRESTTKMSTVIVDKEVPKIFKIALWIVILEIVALVLYLLVSFSLVKVKIF